jgi:hypothetical protein
MTKIYIEDLVGMPEERVYQQLKAHERGFFAIMIPKENTLHYGGVAGIYQDYQLARYLGLCLFRISNMVGFTIPALCERGEFTIVTSTRHFRELAGILCFFASGFDDRGLPRPAFLAAVPELTEEELARYPSRVTALDTICQALESDLSEETLQTLEKQLAEDFL